MNKILIYSDNHFCANSSIVRGRGQKYTIRLENQIKTMQWLKGLANKHNCCGMFCCGDFFDRADLTAEEVSALSEIDFSSVPSYFIVGNHEIGRSDNAFSTANTLLQNNNCEVFDKSSILGIGNTAIFILPYVLENDKKEIAKYFPQDLNIDKPYKLLLTHNDIKGIQLGKFVSTEGFEISDLSKNFDLVVNGHIHNSSWVAENIFNIGNITGQNFSEDAFKYSHNAMILDLDTLSYELFINPYALNFYKVDFTHSDIDEINEVSLKMYNYVATIKTTAKDAQYIKYRFDPSCEDAELERIHCPKHSNAVCCRVIVEHDLQTNTSNKDIESLKLDHIEEFKHFVLSTLGKEDIVLSELQEVLK